MLKKYATSDNLRFVGKAWEIRHALRQEQKRRGAHTSLLWVLRSDKASSK
ncbi:Z-ring formation inhibitor MciZ [Cohnella yongneupensis]|uniref:Z-ring formation inhibitor MciZ n=1 Tax=Cohnella yongneupensis TaxID=425006 RepID=A0ABW0R3G3_9BACL